MGKHDCEKDRGKKAPSIHVRWMIRRDMAEVLEIEATSFQYPWS
jgi:hypothetical protein